jgi:hypothetical protein
LQRIDERVHADFREHARAPRSDFAKQHTEYSLRQVIGFNLVIQREPAQLRRQVPVPADDALHQP